MNGNCEKKINDTDWMSETDIIKIIEKCKAINRSDVLESYSLRKASDKMLGFLSDYWKLEIQVITDNNHNTYNFFIKSISKSNAAKASMVKELNLYEKELTFYANIKEKINLPALPPWSANLVTTLNESMVFEDLNSLLYKTRNKFETFDEHHTLMALQTLARFHAGTLVYEERKRKLLKKQYVIHDEHNADLNRGGYQTSNPWLRQCMIGAMEAIKSYSKYSEDAQIVKEIERRWPDVWELAIDLGHLSLEFRNVICHRDLWNNNILFRYNECHGAPVADSCVLVDFQAVAYQPPAGDVMLLLCCNLCPKFRNENINKFLSYYFRELEHILRCNDITMTDIMSFQQFLNSCDRYKLWGLVVSACLVPQFWLDDDLTTNLFCDTASFEQILTRDKGSFIKRMIEMNKAYKDKVMQVFEEIVDNYCLDKITA